MTIIKITDKRAIIIYDKNVALAEWKTTKVKIKDTDQYIERSAWSDYMWPSNMENAINRMAQEFISNLEITITMKEFNIAYNDFVEQIKAKLNGEGN